jgi:glutamyl-tRNA synthetase
VPDEGETVVHDLIRGDIRFAHAHLDDPVIARADGSALYNFAVAIDDLDAEVTDVVRGEDHLSNTPKQVLVMRALEVEPPRYAHLPLLHGPDGKKLSKRHGAASVQELRDAGYLPEAVRSYIARLGWGTEEEGVISDAELIAQFDITRVNRNPARFDETKLRWLNGRVLRELPVEELTARLEAYTGRAGLAPAVEIAREKIQTLAEFWPLCGFLFDGPADDPAAFERVIASNGGARTLGEARGALESAQPWDAASLETALRDVVERLDVKPKSVFQPVRVAIAGTTISPGIFESLAVLGRDESLRRIDAALERARGAS